MLASAETIAVVAACLKEYDVQNLIVDPVCASCGVSIVG